MGLNNSKSKHSYQVEPAANKPQARPAPPADEAPPAKPKLAPTPVVNNAEAVPKWINQAQFVEILSANVPHFAKIQSFSIKPAMSAGENYATLMLRVSIEAELTDKTIKPISLMMKVPHDIPAMQEMLKSANFFDTENEVYIDVVPKFEEFYKSKGLDLTFAPRAYRFKESLQAEPMLRNSVVMYDLGQDGYKNVNRLEGLNMEQTKVVLRKLAQYHAVSAAYKSVHGPYSDVLTHGMFGNDIDKTLAMLDMMMVPIQKMFLENLKNYDNCEQYHDKLEKYFHKMRKMFVNLGQTDPNEFNVINHGDCWVNNFLFKFDSNDKLLDMLFVDFQNPRYGHPSNDVLYFIMTSVHIDHKLKDFDYFIKYYHDNLIEHLKLLDYKERFPQLVEMQMQMFKYGSWALMASYMVLPVVLLDPTEAATFENFLGQGESAANFKNQMYINKRYKRYIEQILPWLDNRGLLEAFEPPQPEPTTAVASNGVPTWLNSDCFKELLKAEQPDFKEIKDFRVKKATEAGDNYSSIMLAVDIDYETINGQSSTTSYMLKVPPGSSATAALLDLMLTFKKEMAMYNDVIPQLEQLFAEAGQTVVFGPKNYQLQNAPETDHILLQNLRPKGYKNADRLQGLSVAETEHVLAKMAQLHAASAQLYVTKGAYPDCLDKSVYNDATRPIFESEENRVFLDLSMEAVRTFKGSETYGDKVAKIMENMFYWNEKTGVYDDSQFNVLNHGDCWTNNVMFNYDAQGQITDTLFVDFQRSAFNSPAMDLYYFLLSSPTFDIKLEKFDYFVRYYHTELQRNLELLKYPRHIPTLKELHTILLTNPLWASTTVASVMSAVLLDPTPNASIETIIGNNEEGRAFKKKLFNNARYRKHAEAIYPWLDHRGLLDLD